MQVLPGRSSREVLPAEIAGIATSKDSPLAGTLLHKLTMLMRCAVVVTMCVSDASDVVYHVSDACV